MKNTVAGIALAVASCTTITLAQQQPAPTPKAAPAHNVYVLTGCLKAGSDPTATFKLTEASSVGQPVPTTAAEADAVGTSGQKGSYELRPVSGVSAQGVDADTLKAHLGQHVEVTVRPVETPAAPPAGPVAAETAKPIAAAPARFDVTAIKRSSGTCSNE